jgi:MerR family transcriptional regulator, copper efflux regulator
MAEILISELSRTTGFPSSTLRYYERVGILEPAGRTAGGYRVYDGAAVERLAFIGRAKRLGLDLDDVRDLIALWDDGACRPVQARLLTLLHEKIALLDAQIDEHARFRTQLAHVQRSLAPADAADRCGPGCGCDADLPEVVAVSMGRPDRDAPIVCSLGPAAAPERLREWQALLDRVEARRATPDGAVLRFPLDPDLLGALSTVAAKEVACCSFFTFTLSIDAHAAWLSVAAPADGVLLVRELFGPMDG